MPEETSIASDATKSFLEQARQEYVLLNPVSATELEWEAYLANRRGAQQYAPITKETQGPNSKQEDDASMYGDYGTYTSEGNILTAISSTLKDLEKEKALDPGVLTTNFKILSCNAQFEHEDSSDRTVTTHTRVYSPTCPTYVDIHFKYHLRSRYLSVEWSYTLGFKVYRRAHKEDDYQPAALKRFERGALDAAYSAGGWSGIAYGCYDNGICGYGDSWKAVETSAFKLDPDGVRDVHEALWGPLQSLSEDADEAQKLERRRDLVHTVRILLGAVGIDYSIACEDGGRDKCMGVWALEEVSGKWFARETRNACGFQLKKETKKVEKVKEAEGPLGYGITMTHEYLDL